MMERPIIVNSNCYHKYGVEDSLKAIRNLGFHSVELTATKGWTEHIFPSMSFSELLSIRNLISSLGLSVPSISGHCSLMDKERLHDFEENIALAAFFGASIIVSSIGEAHLKGGMEEGDDVLIGNLESIIPSLEKYDMALSLETHGEHGTASRIKEITDRIGSHRIGICYDTANAIFYGNVQGTEDLEKAVESVNYLHIKDKSGKRDEWDFPALGCGYVDFPSLLGVLDANGNASALSIEIEFTSAGSSSIDEVNEALRISRDYLEGLGYKI